MPRGIFTTSPGDLEAPPSLGAVLVYNTWLLKLRSEVRPFATSQFGCAAIWPVHQSRFQQETGDILKL